MKITKTFPRIGLSVVLSLTFFLLPITSINVFASGSTNEGDFWHGLYVEHVTKELSGTGVDIGDATPTDSGLTTGNYVYNQSGVTEQDVKEYVTEQYNNATGYIKEGVEHYTNAVENVWNKTIDSTVAFNYKAEKALRKVVDSAGNVCYNVSSSNYWNGIYNKWFNNNGYKDIYKDGVQSAVSGTVNNKPFSCRLVGTLITTGEQGTDSILTPQWDCYYNCTYNTDFQGGYVAGYPLFEINYDGTIYYKYYWSSIEYRYYILTFNTSTASIDFRFARVPDGESYWGGSFGFLTESNTSVGNVPELQPKQVGFIIYNGEHVPIYTDKTLNPQDWTINDNGTVTVENDGDYPAYVDEKELTGDAWLDMLDLVSQDDERTSTDKDPWGYPWDTQDDGSALGGFFGNLVKDIQKMFKGIGDTVKKIFEKPIDVLSDLVEKIKKALSDFFTIDYDSLDDVELDVNYNIITTIWNKLLELLGVSSGGS